MVEGKGEAFSGSQVTAGLSSASFCRIATRRAALGLRLRRLAHLQQQDAELHLVTRQVNCGSR